MKKSPKPDFLFMVKVTPKRTLISLILLIAVGVGIFFGAHYFINRNTVNQADINALRANVQKLTDQKQYNRIQTDLTNYLNKKMSNQYRYQVAFLLAGNYVNLKNNQAALDWFLKSESLNPGGLTYQLALDIALTAQAANNKQLAINYYQKTIELAKISDNGFDAVYIPSYEQTIKLLQNPNTDFTKVQTQNLPANFPKNLL